jgi:hypothetical protein
MGKRGQTSQMTYLDHFLVKSKWVDIHPASTSNSFCRGLSDHSPIVLNFGVNSNFLPSSFKFDKS